MMLDGITYLSYSMLLPTVGSPCISTFSLILPDICSRGASLAPMPTMLILYYKNLSFEFAPNSAESHLHAKSVRKPSAHTWRTLEQCCVILL